MRKRHPRSVIILIKVDSPVDHTIVALFDHLDPDDYIIDNDNEWYKNIERRMNQRGLPPSHEPIHSSRLRSLPPAAQIRHHLVKTGSPVDHTIATLSDHLDPGYCIIDGDNEWYENTERCMNLIANKGLLYLGIGTSGGENGACHDPSLMPGGSHHAYSNVQDILHKIAAQVEDDPCVTYIDEGGSGNWAAMVGFRGCYNFSDGREGTGIRLNLETQKITKKIINQNEK
ncbi:6-phosphogluconate dehydrogenase, decarboxylating 2, chloroplastic [Glycine soja]